MFCLHTLRKIKLLRYFHHKNIIGTFDILHQLLLHDFTEVYLIQELMETDLHHVIHTQELSNDHHQYFIYLAIDLMEKCLMFGLKCRIKVSEALRHSYLQAYTHKMSLPPNLTICEKKSSKVHALSIFSATPHLMPMKQY
ncbi:hypothetical protein ARMGADRAFT_1078793 [Armillaria gallica]|uniref:Protein kinase domain-containing protein n=1 Tax=Armillaria gallica TaxID=47427 RepID=A0A2H3DLF7_ARMGA|nr:hypothetical protein ARMGADRAFT_1078793 [Armillaria gallica]